MQYLLLATWKYLLLVIDAVSIEHVSLFSYSFGIIPCSAEVEKIKKLMLHNPHILTLSESGDKMDEIIPKNVQQF